MHQHHLKRKVFEQMASLNRVWSDPSCTFVLMSSVPVCSQLTANHQRKRADEMLQFVLGKQRR